MVNKEKPAIAGFFICTAIILDPSVAGTDKTYNHSNETWSVTFPNYTVSGVASCNSITGTPGTAYSGNQNNITQGYQENQPNCWCRMTNPVRSAWVFSGSFGTVSECAPNCVFHCSNRSSNFSDFRRALYGSAGQ